MIRLAILLTSLAIAPPRDDAPVEVHPTDLAARRDLIGKEVVVDDRIKLFWPSQNRTYPDILLQRTPVLFRLPKQFQYNSVPAMKAARLRGILRRDGQTLVCDVTAKPQLFKNDIARLDAETAYLLPNDAARRAAWADWALRRADAFEDDALRQKAIALHAHAIEIELAKPESRTPEAILALARKAREKGIAEPEPSALAHLAFRLRMASARSPEEFDAIAGDTAAFLPDSLSAQNADESRIPERFAEDPAASYRQADPTGRAALDRKLWADATSESLSRRASGADPSTLLALASEAKKALPDRPQVGGEFRRRGLEASAQNVANLRRAEMVELVRTYREDLKEPDRARAIERSWLDARLATLSPTSADSRIELAKDYFSMLGDKAAAAELLRKALELQPDLRDASEQFQRMGYIKTNDGWRDPQQTLAPGESPPVPQVVQTREDTFLGLTPAEVKAQLGEPSRVSRVASQGRISLQWAYDTAKGVQYIDFLQKIGEAQPAVVGRYVVR